MGRGSVPQPELFPMPVTTHPNDAGISFPGALSPLRKAFSLVHAALQLLCVSCPSFLWREWGVSFLLSCKLQSTVGDLRGPGRLPARLPSACCCHRPVLPQHHPKTTQCRVCEEPREVFFSETRCPHVSAGFCTAPLGWAAPRTLSAGSWFPRWS